MKTRKDLLLEILSRQNQPVSSAFLASKMRLSINTIKKLVKQINSEYPVKMILSSRLGYQLNNISGMPEKNSSGIPNNYLERAFYIIKELLLNGSAGDLYDIADDLCISYSTLKGTIQKMNKTFEKFHVKFICKQDQIHISGSEENLRRLAVYVISEETNWQFIDLEAIKHFFEVKMVDQTVAIVHTAFKENNCRLNDFAFMNLILHMLIFVERCLQNKHLPIPLSLDYHSMVEQQPDNYRKLFSDICFNLQKEFLLNMTDGDYYEIYIIIQSNLSHSNLDNMDEVLETVGKDTWQRIYKITNNVCELCRIDLVNDYFLPNFFLHVKKIINSDTSAIYNRNPMLDTIKNECRLIYDIAILFSIQLSEEFHIHISEDETAYLALHVASEINRQNVNEDKLQTILFCPAYRQFQSQLKNQLTQTLGDEIYIKSVVSRIEELDESSYDLILSTVNLKLRSNNKLIIISPFLNEAKKSILLQQIMSYKRIDKKRILLEKFDQIFHEHLFFYDKKFESKNELIHFVCRKMQLLDLVPENFEETVMERENAASTAFSQIAIPHSIRMNAIKTSIAVIIDKNGIPWDRTSVNLVLLFAVNYVDRSSFSQLYESLFSIFDNPDTIQQLIQAESLDHFKKIVETGLDMEESTQ